MPAIPVQPTHIVSRALTGTSNVVLASVLGSIAIVIIFALSVVWLIRYRESLKVEQQMTDKKAAILSGYSDRYEFDRKEISTLYSLQRPKTAVVNSFRTSYIPNSPLKRNLTQNRQSGGQGATPAGQPPERGTVSPPLKSSVWRGRQWVTIARPKTSTTPAKGSPWQPKTARPRGPPVDLEKAGLGAEDKKTRVQRLSQLISKMKHEWHDVDL